MAQEHVHPSRPKQVIDEIAEEAVAQSEKAKAAREALAGVDDLLDEIDEVLAENAEEFVASYVQKGGQ